MGLYKPQIFNGMVKTILITGANKGIGFEMAKQLLRHGYRVVVTGRSESRLEKAVEELKKEKGEVKSLLMDVSDMDSIKKAANDFSKLNLKLDVIVNNAAVLSEKDKSILKDDDSILVEAITTNSYGPLRVTKAFFPFMNKPSRIINMTSGGGSMSEPVGGWSPAYCVSKTLLNSITRQLAYELQSQNIVVNAACPGWTRTDMGGNSAPRSVEKGAETPIWLITEAALNFTGKMFRDKMEVAW